MRHEHLAALSQLEDLAPHCGCDSVHRSIFAVVEPSVASSQVRAVYWLVLAYATTVCSRALCLRRAAGQCMQSCKHMQCAPRWLRPATAGGCTHSSGFLLTAQPCLQTALEAAEAAARAVAEAEEAAALATRLMDAANRYEQQAQDFGHHHHPEGHVSPLELLECCVADELHLPGENLECQDCPVTDGHCSLSASFVVADRCQSGLCVGASVAVPSCQQSMAR